jgi:hypothetical protein
MKSQKITFAIPILIFLGNDALAIGVAVILRMHSS